MVKFLPVEQQLRRQGFSYIAGIDEVGRGPLAGPVVSAAVILKNRTSLPALNDSKKLTPKKRLALFHQIIEQSLDFSITFVPHQTIDETNILKAVIHANNLCVKHLSIKPDFVVIDGRDKQTIDIPFQTIIKGDSRVKSIAAASVLAKVARDHLMEHYHELFPHYGFGKHKGYGTRLHYSNIEKYGLCEIHRKSYRIETKKT